MSKTNNPDKAPKHTVEADFALIRPALEQVATGPHRIPGASHEHAQGHGARPALTEEQAAAWRRLFGDR